MAENGKKIRRPEAEASYRQVAAIGDAVATLLDLRMAEASELIGQLKDTDQTRAQALEELADQIKAKVQSR